MSEFENIIDRLNSYKDRMSWEDLYNLDSVREVRDSGDYDDHGNYTFNKVFSYAESDETRDIRFFEVNCYVEDPNDQHAVEVFPVQVTETKYVTKK